MAQKNLNIGTYKGDPSADELPDAMQKVQDNFDEVYQADLDESAARVAADAALQTQIDDLEAAQNAGLIAFETKAAMDADLAHDENTPASVNNDSTASNNGYYRKTGASGAGSWVKRDDFYATTLDETDTSEAVTGKAVGDFVGTTAKAYLTTDSTHVFDYSTYDNTTPYNGFGRVRLNAFAAVKEGYVKATLKVEREGLYTFVVLDRETPSSDNFKIVKTNIVELSAGSNTVQTNLILEVGQYLGVIDFGGLTFEGLGSGNADSYLYIYPTSDQTIDSFTAFTNDDSNQMAFYYETVARTQSDVLEQELDEAKTDLSETKDLLKSYHDTESEYAFDYSAYDSDTFDDTDGRIRFNYFPALKKGFAKAHIKVSALGNYKFVVLQEDPENLGDFKVVASNTIALEKGDNEVHTNLVLEAGQFLGVVEYGTLNYDNFGAGNADSYVYVRSSEDEAVDTYETFTNLDDIDLAFYHEITPRSELDVVEATLDNKIIQSPALLFKRIGDLYNERFLGTSKPVPALGSWNESGVVAYNDGATITPESDSTAYIEWAKYTNFPNDGVKWRVKINDNTSEFRLERRAGPDANNTKSSSVAYDNGTLKIYEAVNAVDVPSTVVTSKNTSLTIVNGREYNVILEYKFEVLSIRIIDTVTGEEDSLSYNSARPSASNVGSAWDYPRFVMLSGDVEIKEMSYYVKLPHSPKVVVIGDSIVEGFSALNEVGGGFANTYAGLLYNALHGDVTPMGTASSNSQDFIDRKLDIFNAAFKNPDYVIWAHFTNDTSSFTTWRDNTITAIAAIEAKGAIPVIGMMPARSGTTGEAFYDDVLEWVEENAYKVIWFDRALTNGDGKTKNTDDYYYVDDFIHPNPEGYRRMFQQIQVDLPELFD